MMNPAWITFVKCNVNYICQNTCKINNFFFLWKKVPMKTKCLGTMEVTMQPCAESWVLEVADHCVPQPFPEHSEC